MRFQAYLSSKLKLAGYDKVLAELPKQLDAYKVQLGE